MNDVRLVKILAQWERFDGREVTALASLLPGGADRV